ncbi:hypothetical protein ICN48_07110 [Polynucleobacter sp. JS-Safj-400b-B2]|uniref:hypothetical protein n=1 Tax=Polynucleobacter sp. JS-Safj-400b-B2 TaxID=2576921 RepID=UPI001C0AECE1|nr:hypothetical protein [Polynucleobacter sp. JS-Safj-400b-B2]MBU3626002.1 hypothetical protein [Polynucleobacter sp. JS-Safj-400b-B2]
MTWQPLGCNPVTYSCPNGYTLSGQTCSIAVLSAAIPNYYCSSGVLSGVSCVTSSSYAATANWYCPSGGSLSGTTCTKAGSQPATGTNYSYGPPGAYWDGAWGVWRVSCASGAANGWGTGIGPDARNRSMCGYYSRTGTSYSCPSGGSLSGSTCYTTSAYAASISSYSCISGGVLSGASCTITSSSAASISSYYCNSGVLTGSQCSITVTVPATAN